MIRTMKALVRREYWEHRGAFLKTPIIVGIVLITLTIIAYISSLVFKSKSGSDEMVEKSIRKLAHMDPDHLIMFWDIQMTSISTLYIAVLFFVLFFFLLGSLFDDRKNGSILFWKSMPVSDATTVLSKLITAMFLVPLIFVSIYILLILILMLLYSIILLFHGLNPIQLVWSPAQVWTGILMVFSGIFVQMLWALPIYGWLLLSSAFSKRRPFLFATFIPAIFSFSWYWLNVLTFKFTDFDMFKVPLTHLGHAMFPYAQGSIGSGGFHFGYNDNTESLPDTLGLLKSLMMNVEILYGAIFAAILVSLAIWIRRYRNTT